MAPKKRIFKKKKQRFIFKYHLEENMNSGTRDSGELQPLVDEISTTTRNTT